MVVAVICGSKPTALNCAHPTPNAGIRNAEPTISNMLAANLALNGRTNVLVVREGLAEASGGVSVRYNEFDALNNYGSSVVRTDRRSNTRVAPLDAYVGSRAVPYVRERGEGEAMRRQR